MLAGLTIRALVHGRDDAARAAIHNRALCDREGFAPISAADIARWNLAPSEKDQRRFIAELHGEAVGTSAGFAGPGRTDGVGFMVGPTVVPECRRRGIGTALAGAVLDELHKRGAKRAEAEVADRPVIDAFLRSLGFTPAHAASTMRRRLDALPPAMAAPVPIEIRSLDESPTGIAAYVILHNECFRDYPGIGEVTPAIVRYRLESLAAAGAIGRVMVAYCADEQTGLINASYSPHSSRATGIRRGQVYDLAVAKRLRGRGIGTALMLEAMRWLRDEGVEEAELSVDDFNTTGARKLYERLGFAVADREVIYSLDLNRGWAV
jgi:mycothiol synthase